MALEWEEVSSRQKNEYALYPVRVSRAKVPGGWLIYTWEARGHAGGPSITFYPDPDHLWNGNSLP